VFWAASLALRGAKRSVRIVGVISTPVMASAFYQGIGVFAAPVWAAFVWLCISLMAMAQFENVNALRANRAEAGVKSRLLFER